MAEQEPRYYYHHPPPVPPGYRLVPVEASPTKKKKKDKAKKKPAQPAQGVEIRWILALAAAVVFLLYALFAQ